MTLTRHASSTLTVEVSAVADLIFSVAVSTDYTQLDETLTFRVGEQTLEAEEVIAPSGSRLHRIRQTPVGTLSVDYAASVTAPAPEPPLLGIDEILFTRPSRYCDSDRLNSLAAAHFPGLGGMDLINEVARWVRANVRYQLGSSRVVDGALDTYVSRTGVCRDYAHLVIAFLRAHNVPARMVSVYAPGLNPMDFHAVVEAFFDGRWHLIDATGLAPRGTMVRICTGRDASDTAFMTTLGGQTRLTGMRINAWVDGDLPTDDFTDPATLT